MRLLLMLSIDEENCWTLDNLVFTDFITCYSKEFGITDSNLHGDNEFSFTEIAARRNRAKKALLFLTLCGQIIAYSDKNGFHYTISAQGISFCQSLTSDYAQEYLFLAGKTREYVGTKTETELLALIVRRAANI